MSKFLDTAIYILFIISLVLVVIFGIAAPENHAVMVTLVTFGALIGLLSINIATAEIVPLLIALMLLVVVGAVFEVWNLGGIGYMLDRIIRLLAVFMAPMAVIFALKVLVQFGLKKSKIKISIDK